MRRGSFAPAEKLPSAFLLSEGSQMKGRLPALTDLVVKLKFRPLTWLPPDLKQALAV